MVIGYSIGCTIGGWYHGGINMCGLGVNHPNDPIGGLNGGSPNSYLSNELHLGEFPSCIPFSGWWTRPLGTKVIN